MIVRSIKNVLKPYKNYVDILIRKRSLSYQDWLVRQHDFYSDFIKPGDLVFDIGANIGDKTEVFLSMGARVVSVEPQSQCARIIRWRCGRNKALEIIQKGVAEKDGKLVLSICEDSSAISTFSSNWKMGRFSHFEWNRSENVAMITLNDLIEEYGVPVFCKIDVEGYECKVLQGLNYTLPLLCFEFTKEFFNDAKKCIEKLNHLKMNKFNWALGEMRLADWVTGDELITLLEQNQNQKLHGDIYARSE